MIKDASANKVIVKVKEGATFNKAKASAAGVQSVSEFDAATPKFDQFYVVDLKAGMSAASADKTLSQLEDLPEVEFVEAVQRYSLHSEDIYYDEQYDSITKINLAVTYKDWVSKFHN